MIALPPLVLPPVALASPPAHIARGAERHDRGIVSAVGTQRLTLFIPKTRRLVVLTVPPGFHGVDSNDGVVRDATVARARAGMLADVTYRSEYGRHVVTRIDLLTQAACNRLSASQLATGKRPRCPD